MTESRQKQMQDLRRQLAAGVFQFQAGEITIAEYEARYQALAGVPLSTPEQREYAQKTLAGQQETLAGACHDLWRAILRALGARVRP